MPESFLHALLPLAGLTFLLTALDPRRAWARVLAVGFFELYLLRYLLWRATATLPQLEPAPAALWQWSFFCIEAGSIAFLCWSMLVVARRSDNSGAADEGERQLRVRPAKPRVTVLIPTVNEPREVLEGTIRAATLIDYPSFEVCVLDDDKGPKPPAAPRRGPYAWWGWLIGRGTSVSPPAPVERVHAWLPELCKRYGVRYLRRDSSAGAKAGNLNHGLACSEGEVLLVLDADFQAQANILWRTVGLLDDEVALVQTPQHYYSTDPIQHNLRGSDAWTEEQRYFFDIVLPARDACGAAMCVGTSFVVRREALGPSGFETECLSEDIYLGYALASRGYRVLYLNEPLSFGAAADSVSEYVRQRVRWSQGSVQSLWLPYGPFRAPGLSLSYRVFQLEAPMYWVTQFGFLGAVLVAPVVYLFTGTPAFLTPLDEAMAFIFPRIIVAAVVTYWISCGKIMPIVTDIKKMVCVQYVLAALVSLLVKPGGKPFIPTLKGEQRDVVVVHWEILWLFLLYAGVLTLGLGLNLFTDRGPAQWDEYLPVNVAWSLYGLGLTLLTALACVDQPKDTRRLDYLQTINGRWLRALCALGAAVFGRSR